MELYTNNPSSFPSRTREKEYKDRLERTYPIHPELFDHLYHNWSTMPRFQQTRGVLRLMASVIHSLWIDKDESLMIMPGTIPLDDPNVRVEFTKFLGTGWNNIIESEIDGENSVAVTIDRGNVNMGQVAAARRVSRTLFLATSPMENASQHGIESRSVCTGSVQPGEKPPVFADAVGHIARESVYLYSENERYWYSERPTLRKLAEDRKAQALENREELIDVLINHMKKSPRATDKSDFARIHIAPKSASDVADRPDVGLVIISPEEAHLGGNAGSDAMARSKQLLDSRGTGPRINRNAILFAAADKTRLETLLDAVAAHQAWSSIVFDADTKGTLEVTKGQVNGARGEVEIHARAIQERIAETYRWLLVPEQSDATSSIEIREHRIKASKSIAQNAIELLYKNEWLFATMDGPRLRFELDNVPLWKNNIVSVKNLTEFFARYVYLPRAASPSVIEGAINEGVGRMLWNPETFAYSSAVEADGSFKDLVAGEILMGVSIVDGMLVHPDVAQKQLDSEPGPAIVGPGHKPQPDPGPGPEPPIKPAKSFKKRFFGSVILDPLTPSSKMGQIMEEILVHLTNANANVRLHLEIEATDDNGFSEGVVQTVSENAATLGFDEKGFEDE